MAAELKIVIDDSGVGSSSPAPGGGSPSPLPRGGAPVPFPSPGPATSAVPAFDRPIAVIVMGPNPLPVTIVGDKGKGNGAGAGPAKPPEGWGAWAFRNAGKTAGAAGVVASGAAANKAMPAFNTVIAGATMGLARLGPYGLAAAAAVGAAGASVVAFKGTVDAFVARGRELSGYNGNLAASSAIADVRKLVTDLREADKLGDLYAKLTEAHSKNEQAMSELLMWLKGPLIEFLTVSLNAANNSLVSILECVDKLTLHTVPGLGDLIKDIKRILAGDDLGGLNKLVNEWLNAPRGIRVPAPVPR